MLSGEAAHTNFIVFSLARLALEPTIYCTRDEHANHYTIDVVSYKYKKYIYSLLLYIHFYIDTSVEKCDKTRTQSNYDISFLTSV
jgi:hypothetical protein